MPSKKSGLDLVRKLAMKLPGVEEGTIHGAPSWKLGSKLLTCPAIHKSAEPNSLVVKIALDDREKLLAAAPETYYLTDHYRDNPMVLVRLAKIDRQSLQELLAMAHRFVSESGGSGRRKTKRR